MPLVNDQLDQLQNAKISTTIDLKNGFLHVPVAEESRRYTALVTPTGQYEFLETPFGICVAPAIFQKFIHAVFRELIHGKIVFVYMNDIIILANTIDVAMERLRQVVNVAGRHALIINWTKCKF